MQQKFNTIQCVGKNILHTKKEIYHFKRLGKLKYESLIYKERDIPLQKVRQTEVRILNIQRKRYTTSKGIWTRLNDNLTLLSKLGKNIHISEDVKKNLETFTIRVVYNDKNSSTLNEARASKWMQMKNKGTIRLSPDYDSFEQHLKRSNYVTYSWFSYDNPDASISPLNHGFMLGDNENLFL